MNDISPYLIDLLSKPGLTGYEEPVSRVIAEKWQPLVDELTTSPLGSLHGLRKSSAPEKRPSLMIATHMDAIGLMVKDIEHGLLHITKIGGIDPRILPGQLVTVHASKEIPGVVQFIPDRLLGNNEPNKPPTFERLFIDTGLNQKDLERLIKPGDLASFSQPPFTLGEGYIAGHSLDNRASVAALTVCLEEIRNYNLDCNVIAVATVQEEWTAAGAYTSAYGLRPDLAIVVDVTFAKGPGVSDYRSFPLGEGPSIGIGANNHPGLVDQFTMLAKEMDMPFGMEAMPASSGTDGMAIQVTANGIPVIVLGVAIRYMHTSVEMAGLKDIYRTGRLLARFITGLNSDLLKTIFAEKK